MRVAQGSGRRTRVFYDADCGFCTHTADVLGRLDRAGRLELVPLQEAEQAVPDAPPADRLLARMHVRDAGGRWSEGSAAWVRIAELVPALRPLAWVSRVPIARLLIEPVYGLAARNRHRVSRLLGGDACRAGAERR